MARKIAQLGLITLLVAVSGLMACKQFTGGSEIKEDAKSKVADNTPPLNTASTEAISAMIFEIKDAGDIAPRMKRLQEMAKTDPVARFYHAILGPLMLAEGLTPRFRMIAEQSHMLHTSVLQFFYSLAYGSYTQPAHINALMQFVTEPSGQPVFTDVSELQTWLVQDVAKALEASIKTIEELMAAGNFPEFQVDKAIFASTDQRMDRTDRYKRFHPGFLQVVRARLHYLAGGAYAFAAYELDDFLPFLNHLLDKSGLNQNYANTSGVFTRTDGASSKNIVDRFITPLETASALDKIRDHQVLTLKGEGGAASLYSAWEHFGFAAEFSRIGYDEVTALEEKTSADLAATYLYNPKETLIDREKNRGIAADLEKMFKAKGPVNVTSPVTGSTFPINVWALFNGANEAVKNRKTLYPGPDGFNGVNKTEGEGPDYRINYSFGSPKAWPDPTFGGFLPGVTDETVYQRLRDVALTESTACLLNAIPVPHGRSPTISTIPFFMATCNFAAIR